jgi:hypothetical protein
VPAPSLTRRGPPARPDYQLEPPPPEPVEDELELELESELDEDSEEEARIVLVPSWAMTCSSEKERPHERHW